MAHPSRIFPAFVLMLLAAAPASASSSDWIETDGGRVRLVSAGQPDADGRLRGALEIALEPGWKTYWRDPGGSGVPPAIEVAASTNVADAEIGFPVPKWFDDGYSVWAGYDRPVSLPVTFTAADPDRFAFVEAEVFLGICQTICIPVTGKLSLDPGSAPDDPGDAATVAAAFAALPSPATDGFEISSARLQGTEMIVEAAVPAGEAALNLFVAGNEDWMLGRPKRVGKGEAKAIFAVPVLTAPEAAAGPDRKLHYTLAAGDRAVAGTLDPPRR